MVIFKIFVWIYAFQSFFFFFRHMKVPRLGAEAAAAAGLHHSHSNIGSELSLLPQPQLTAILDP